MKSFLDEHLPKVPNFVEENLPRLNPMFQLGAPVRKSDPSLLDFYFNGNPRELHADSIARPDHYTAEQKALLETLMQKKPLPMGATQRDINELVLRFTERTEQRKKREQILQKVHRKLEDPTIERKVEEDAVAASGPAEPAFIKII
jgi:hypothetical protein